MEGAFYMKITLMEKIEMCEKHIYKLEKLLDIEVSHGSLFERNV